MSPLLCNVVGGQDMSHYLREEGYIRLIQCFLQPGLMLERKESPNSLTERQVLELGSEGKVQVMQRQGPQMDPVYQLFQPDNPEELGRQGGRAENFDLLCAYLSCGVQTNRTLTSATLWPTCWLLCWAVLPVPTTSGSTPLLPTDSRTPT